MQQIPEKYRSCMQAVRKLERYDFERVERNHRRLTFMVFLCCVSLYDVALRMIPGLDLLWWHRLLAGLFFGVLSMLTLPMPRLEPRLDEEIALNAALGTYTFGRCLTTAPIIALALIPAFTVALPLVLLQMVFALSQSMGSGQGAMAHSMRGDDAAPGSGLLDEIVESLGVGMARRIILNRAGSSRG